MASALIPANEADAAIAMCELRVAKVGDVTKRNTCTSKIHEIDTPDSSGDELN